MTKEHGSSGIDRRIWETVELIPTGSVASYAQIAEEAGLPGGARRVGKALARLSAGSAVPWHRVLRTDGTLAFEPGSASYVLQRRLLESEGIVFRGRSVDWEHHRWRP